MQSLRFLLPPVLPRGYISGEDRAAHAASNSR
jgi:hypothetical protein